MAAITKTTPDARNRWITPIVEACTSTSRSIATRACSSVKPAFCSEVIVASTLFSEETSSEREVRLASSHAVVAIAVRSEEHTSELQSLMRISYAVFCLKNKKEKPYHIHR